MQFSKSVRIATHDGSFHADDVLALAILTTLYKDHQVIRTRDPDTIEWCDLAVDVGGIYDHANRRYDHHMSNPPSKGDRHLYSSAGLIWRHYGAHYLEAIGVPRRFSFENMIVGLIAAVEDNIRLHWIEPIDRTDNGLTNETTPLSSIVQVMRPIDPEKSRISYDAQFLETVSVASMLFKRACFHAADFAIGQVKHLYGNKEFFNDNKIVFSEHAVVSPRSYIGSGHHFVIFPSLPCPGMPEYFIIRTVQKDQSSDPMTPFPEILLGGRDKTISDITKKEGVYYVHHNGFMALSHTKEAAIQFCQLCLNVADHP